MSRKSFDKKTLIWMILAVIAFVIVVVAIVITNLPEKIDSSYFHDDDKKIVLTMDKEMSALDDSPYESGIVHVVYYYDGDKITNVRAFYEYPDEEMAKIAMLNLKTGDFATSMKLNGRFVIFQINKSQYENMTVEMLKENIELLKEIDALILDYDENTILRHPVSFIEENDDASGESGSSEDASDSSEDASDSDGSKNDDVTE